ncbi:MAG: ATP-binding protein [Bryobacteraceae bacterium]|nr:ATP-binding protein [Bryobacteraceae bacterium]
MAENQNDAAQVVEKQFDSTLDSVDEAENLILNIAGQTGFTEDDLHRLGMAVREAMVNAVVHGNRYNLRKKVHLTVASEPTALRITILDEGEGFEPQELPDPLAEENLLRQSGRGLLLIQAFVDEFQMRKAEPPLGTKVMMAIHRNPESEAGGPTE